MGETSTSAAFIIGSFANPLKTLANIGQKHKHQSMDRWGRALTSKSSSEYRTLFLWGKGEGERRHHQSQVHIFQHLSKLRLWCTWRICLKQVQWAYNTHQLTELHFSSGCFFWCMVSNWTSAWT